MKKLTHAVAAALLMLPMLAPSAQGFGDSSRAGASPPTHSLAGTCYINLGGIWIGYPC